MNESNTHIFVYSLRIIWYATWLICIDMTLPLTGSNFDFNLFSSNLILFFRYFVPTSFTPYVGTFDRTYTPLQAAW